MVAAGSRFSTSALRKLLNSPNACVYHKQCTRHVALTPNALNDTKVAIRENLNRLLTKYDLELDGVVLGFRNINVLTSYGYILDDSPDIHFDIDAEFFLFKPERGKILTGVVKKKNRDNISCLVHDIFNASIPVDVDGGRDSMDIEHVSVGEPLTFTVEEVNFTDSIPYIRGKLVSTEEKCEVQQMTGRKRKRGDDLNSCKKMKAEEDSSVSMDENKYLKKKKSKNFEHLNSAGMETEGNFQIKFSSKHPTSILKKSGSVGIENSPARRISFYGDAHELPTKMHDSEKDIEENKISKKTKKSKNENENSYLETDSVHSKKKKKMNVVENETLQEEETRTETEQSEKSGSTKEKKKKKKKKINELAEIPNESIKESEHLETETEVVHSKRKKKSKNVLENINLRDNENPEPIEQLETPATEKQKSKKKNKEESELEEFHSENLKEDCISFSDVIVQPKKKKKYTTVVNEDHDNHMQAEQILVSVAPMSRTEEKKKKKENVLREQHHKTLEYIGEIQTKKKKKKTKKEESKVFGTDEVLQGGEERRRERTQVSPFRFASDEIASFNQGTINITPIHGAQVEQSNDDPNKRKKKKRVINSDQGEVNISYNDDADINLSIDDNEKKKRKKKSQANIGEISYGARLSASSDIAETSCGERLDRVSADTGEVSYGALSSVSKKKPAANSTVIANATPSTKKKRYNESDSSFQSLSPINRIDGPVAKFEDVEFVTSTQIDSHLPADVHKKKQLKASATEKSRRRLSTAISESELHNQQVDTVSVRETTLTGNFQKSSVSPKMSQTLNKSQKTSDTCSPLYKTVVASSRLPSQVSTSVVSDSDSDSHTSSTCSSGVLSPNHISLISDKKSWKKSVPVKTKGNQGKVMTLKPAGSDSSSSDTDVSSPELANILHKLGNKNKKKNFQETLIVKTADIDKSSDENSMALEVQEPNVVQRTVLSTKSPNENDSKSDSSDSDLPSDRNIRKKLAKEVGKMTKRIHNQPPNPSTPIKTFSNTGEHLAADSDLPLKKKLKAVKGENILPLEKLQEVPGSVNAKKSRSSVLKPGGSVTSSSDSDDPPSAEDKIISLKKLNKKTTNVPKKVSRLQSPEKNLSDSTTDSIVKGLLQKVKLKILEPSESSNMKVNVENKKSKLKPSVAHRKKTSKSKDSLIIEKVAKKLDDKHMKPSKKQVLLLADKLLQNLP